ncbi:hypothetical protein [Sessilibacter corallicola]|uniref:hypothetical protein n=1 Tax=Sessilibacter corallicola TaxID=2904075 RepID=UPI001E427D94|nr:hypothetical protein [Sessilibacter corallicola]MCE2028511.1 hypothetical protein [Sessilibacter corallicola]
MNTLTLLFAEAALCVAVSIALILLIKPPLKAILTDTCGTVERANFWVMFTQLMLVISPLMVVIYYAPTTAYEHINLADELRQAVFRILLGGFIALAVIGRVIGKSIKADNP